MYIDLHCDSIIKNVFQKDQDLYQNEYSSVTIEQMKKVQLKAQFFAIYLYNDDYYDYPGILMEDKDYIRECVLYLKKMEKKYRDSILVSKGYKDYQKALSAGKTAIFISVEDGRVIKKMEDLFLLKDLGVSLVTLLWNHENSIGYPNSRIPSIMNKGLKPFGKEVVAAMDELSMIIDVSHLSDGGFWDVLDISKKPLVASHSNSRSLVNHPRNLTDDMIQAIGERGGIIGANICPAFLSSIPKDWHSRKSDYLEHIKHIINVGGEDVISIGSDFDGILGDLEISNVIEMNEFLLELKKSGFTEDQIEKMSYRNAERVLKESLA